MSYGTSVTVRAPFAETVTRVREALAGQGFGVLTEIGGSPARSPGSPSDRAVRGTIRAPREAPGRRRPKVTGARNPA